MCTYRKASDIVSIPHLLMLYGILKGVGSRPLILDMLTILPLPFFNSGRNAMVVLQVPIVLTSKTYVQTLIGGIK